MLHRFDKVLPIEPIIDLVITDLASKVMPTIAELQTELDDARREVRNLTVLGMSPKLSPEKAALVRDLERSARAEVTLRFMALEYAREQKRLHSRRKN